MRFILRAFWVISFLGFLYNLFTTYGNLQQILKIQIGSLALSLTRSQFFFFFLIFFLIFNVALYMYSKAIYSVPNKIFLVPFKSFWTSDKENRRAANHILDAWTWAFACTVNYFLIFWMLVVENNFHFEGNTVSSVSWFYIPGLIMLASLIIPVFRLMVRNTNLLQRAERE